MMQKVLSLAEKQDRILRMLDEGLNELVSGLVIQKALALRLKEAACKLREKKNLFKETLGSPLLSGSRHCFFLVEEGPHPLPPTSMPEEFGSVMSRKRVWDSLAIDSAKLELVSQTVGDLVSEVSALAAETIENHAETKRTISGAAASEILVTP